ncbi:MAG TPA: RidA family protein [Candidatus Obscuribacterales bacterium]
MLQTISTEKAPKAVGPYSQAIKTPGFVFCSGQIPLDPASGQLVTGSIADQTRQVLTNLSNVLTSAGSDLSKVVKTTVFLKDMKDFEEMNAIYGEFFTQQKPARSTIQVAGLPKNANIEIEAIALV